MRATSNSNLCMSSSVQQCKTKGEQGMHPTAGLIGVHNTFIWNAIIELSARAVCGSFSSLSVLESSVLCQKWVEER